MTIDTIKDQHLLWDISSCASPGQTYRTKEHTQTLILISALKFSVNGSNSEVILVSSFWNASANAIRAPFCLNRCAQGSVQGPRDSEESSTQHLAEDGIGWLAARPRESIGKASFCIPFGSELPAAENPVILPWLVKCKTCVLESSV